MGKKTYNAPLNCWDSFVDAVLAKEIMSGDYILVDLSKMSDSEIASKKHLGILEFFLKHIHDKDILKVWEKFFENFKPSVDEDRENGFIYLKSFLCYSGEKLTEEELQELGNLIKSNLDKEGEIIMKSAAQSYREEGRQLGKYEGIQIGKLQIARNLLLQGLSVESISQATGLSKQEIEKLKK